MQEKTARAAPPARRGGVVPPTARRRPADRAASFSRARDNDRAPKRGRDTTATEARARGVCRHAARSARAGGVGAGLDGGRAAKKMPAACFFLAMATNGPYSQLVFTCGENNFRRGSG